MSSPQMESHYYLDSRFLVMQAETTSFRLPISLLTLRCPSFANSVTIPAETDLSLGQSVENPVVLVGVKAVEFEAFLDYLYPHRDLPPFSTEGLEGILNLSQVYSVPDGVEFAKNRLYAEKNNIPPAHFLSMAIKYRMPLFFMDAFSRLAHNPLHNLSSADLDLIPSSVLCKLLAVHQSIRSYRQELVLRKPASYRHGLHAAGCRRGCVSHMRVGWDTVAVPLLLSSEWFPAWRIHKLLMESLQSYGICRPCTNRYRLAFQDILPNAESEMFVKANAEARKAEGFEY